MQQGALATDALKRLFRERGIPVTVQRLAIYRELASRTDHPTADMVFDAVSSSLSGMSRTTVYRSLETFAELGLVHRISHPSSSARYDANPVRHHHLLCDRCGAVRDIQHESLESLDIDALAPSDFHARAYNIEIRGRCAECA